ncbi:hypothetical protein Tco_0962590 [Tanacetum coccineum]
MESLQETMAALQEAMNNMMTQLVNAELEALKNGERTSTNRGSHMNNTHYGRMTKIEFPRFNGDDVKGWMYRCKQFFKIDGIEEERKVELASMHMYDQALVWHQQYVKKYGERTPWEMYEGEVEAFETLLNRVELNEAYDVSLFIGGLKKELSMPIKMFKISNLTDVYAMAKMQEATNAVLNPRYNSPLLPTPKIVPNSTFVNKTVNTPFKSANMNGGNQIMSRNGGNRSHRLTGKEFTIPLQISIANGQNMMSCYECKNFQWSLQGETFTSDVMLLPFGGCEMVLGIQWLATLGDIQCNFQHLTNVTWNAERSGTKSRNGNAVRGSLKFGTSEGRLISIIQAYDTIPPPQVIIALPAIVPPPMFDSQDFFPPEKISPPKDAETPVESPIPISPSSSVRSSSPVRSTTSSPDYPFDKILESSELQAKDTTIKNLKAQIKRVNETSTSESVKNDLDKIETINIELEHRVTKLIAENEHLKQTYKQLYDSIKQSRVRAKEHTDSLVNQLNQKSVDVTDLNAQLQEKVFVITALKNDLRKLKGKEIADNAAHVSNATTIALGMYKLDLVILAPKVKNNREAHEYYLKHTMDQAAILRRSKLSTSASGSKPSDNIKNDRISQTQSSNEKNKVEVQSRKVKSSLNKRNSDSKMSIMNMLSILLKVLRLFVLYAMNVCLMLIMLCV